MFDVRPCRDREELTRAYYAIGQYFGAPPKEEQLDRLLQVLPLERMLAAFDGEEVVGGAASFAFELTVPGGSLPCAGVSIVGVYPTHRRRGVLRSMMRAQLDGAHERGEPLAALWASEETIYGRFGYGIASWAGDVTVPREWTAFAQPLDRRGRVRFVEAEEAAELFPVVHEAFVRQRPGAFARQPAWWRNRILRVPDAEAASPRRFVVLELGGEPAAYAVFRREMGWERNVPSARLEVLEAIGATPQATAVLWRWLLDVDWTATFEARRLPPDHPLLLLLATPRRARYALYDALWLRLVDVGVALAGRVYEGEGSVVLEVRDEFCPWNAGRWVVAAGAAERTDEPADLALDVAALGAAYLGGISFGALRDALRVEERVERAVARADELFAWRPLPWCPEIF